MQHIFHLSCKGFVINSNTLIKCYQPKIAKLQMEIKYWNNFAYLIYTYTFFTHPAYATQLWISICTPFQETFILSNISNYFRNFILWWIVNWLKEQKAEIKSIQLP